ncbi:sensor histidine kinase [Polaromonas sp.]|uniref:sensor histidine kinase n=1 Tax=Polaromonas sp. TaxID=1869339 RepID=UPI003CB18389
MKKTRITSIRSSLAWLVAACLVPAIVMAALLLTYDYRRQRAELVRDTVAHARALIHAVDREFAGAEMSLRSLSTSPSLQSQDFAAFQEQATTLLHRHYANNIVLIDAGGQQRINTARPYGQPLPKATNMAQLERVLKNGRTDISDLFIGPVLKRPLINVAVPVYSGNTVSHSLVAVVLPDHLQKILSDYRFPPNRIATIFDASGVIVARTREAPRFIGQPVGPDLTQRLAEADEASLESVSREGIPVLTVFTRSPTSRWGVAIGIPVESLTEELRRSLWLLSGLAMLLLASSLGLAWLMGGRIVQSVRALRSAALSLGYGRGATVPALEIREVDEVGQAITRASLMLTDASKALTDSEARMRGIVESATDAIVILDDSRNIVLFNFAAVTMFGCPLEDAIGTPFIRFIPERLRADFSAQLLTPREPVTGEEEIPIKVATAMRLDGEEFAVEISFPQVLAGGSEVHTLILRDITARLRIHEALERSNLDLQQFAYVASHDLKTPLRSIGGFVQLLEKDYASKLDERAVALIRRTAAAATRLEQLTDDLLSYARVSSDSRAFAPVDCSEVFEDVLQLLDAPISASGAGVTAGPLPTVTGDRTQLVQLLLNLVANGIKYCDGPPLVHVFAEMHERVWVFSVRDNGIGIEPKHHERIFEIFKRLHTQQEYTGTGIGLAICRRVVISHGGRIWIESAPGKGSTFRFTIPATAGESSSS